MSWLDTGNQPISAEAMLPQEPTNKQETGSDGKHSVTPSHGEKLLPLLRAMHNSQTCLSDRDIHTFSQAYITCVEESDPKPLMDWLNAYKIRKARFRNTTPKGIRAKGIREKGTSLYDRDIQSTTIVTKMIQAAEHLISSHMHTLTPKGASGNAGATARTPLTKKMREKALKRRRPDGDSHFTPDSNTGPDIISAKEIEEGLDSLRDTPNSLIPKKDNTSGNS